ncbi:hypothetical protein FOA52_009971 [Chlamydomonas sp. UWO 241]|nr:hypothetical protein FOA52_009971 [Chlamydomonas sp. UWO 241]
MEAEATAITARLNAPGEPGLKGALIDKEGYPRADIDIFQVRTDRHRLACLSNDHKQISNTAERLLAELHAAARSQAQASTAPGTSSAPGSAGPSAGGAGAGAAPAQGVLSSGGGVSAAAAAASPAAAAVPAPPPPPSVPFAVVDEVADASPAAGAGIQLWKSR